MNETRENHPMNKRHSTRPGILRARIGAGLAAGLVAGAVACNFDVTNPGPVQDEFLNNPGAFQAVVNGAVRRLNSGLNYTAFHGAIVTRELFPTGQTGQFGVEPKNSVGFLEENEQGTPWGDTQQGRWLVEDGLRRFQDALGDADFNKSGVVALGYLWAGYANRILGENMCEAVFDGGSAEPRTTYLTRAEEDFTKAITIGTAASQAATVQAATAARAATRLDLGNWTGAVADATGIPIDFVFQMKYHEVGDVYQYNRIAWASMNQPYKAHTVWGTVYEDYYEATNDPRTPFQTTNQVGTGALDCCGSVPWYPQKKYAATTGIDLSTGTEMRLIEAEAKLRDGAWQDAMTLINSLRTRAVVATVTAANATEAWTALKRERGIELWMEGRRLNDLRRWKEGNTPGALDPREVVGAASHLDAQDLCFPISKAEKDTNPNVR